MAGQGSQGVWRVFGAGPVVRFCAVGLPFVVIGIYALVTGVVLDPADLPAFHSEAGPVELVTAALMLIAAAAAFTLALKLRRRGHGRLWIAWYLLIAAGAMFVCLEEISYGQHMMGWQSPEFFEEHNKQHEMNVHNLYGDALSSGMRKAVNTALPLGAILVPLVLMRREASYRRGDWTWYTVPMLEIAVWVAVAGLSSAVRKLGDFSEGHWNGSLSEFKEMLWACALLMYLGVMWRRLLSPPPEMDHETVGAGHPTRREGEAEVAAKAS